MKVNAPDILVLGDFSELGVPFQGPNKKDYSILGYTLLLGSLYLDKLPIQGPQAQAAHSALFV